MHPLSLFSTIAARPIAALFTDIDDTLTEKGKLHASTYAALQALSDSGCHIIPVTGRPAGWCDMIARQWPVSAVIGENGAFIMHHDHQRNKLLLELHPQLHALEKNYTGNGVKNQPKTTRAHLLGIAQMVLQAVPGAALASDQAFRIADIAIDFCEDVPRLPDAAIEKIVQLLSAQGLTVKVSSIHVNAWLGTYTKLDMAQHYAQQHLQPLGANWSAQQTACVFVGDSANDEPLFAAFENAVGVANVRDFLPRMQAHPRFITPSRGGAGFVEVAQTVLAHNARIKNR